MSEEKLDRSEQELQEEARKEYEERIKRTPEDEEFFRQLLERGLLEEITPPIPFDQIPKGRQPIPVEGQPVSEFLLEERR